MREEDFELIAEKPKIIHIDYWPELTEDYTKEEIEEAKFVCVDGVLYKPKSS